LPTDSSKRLRVYVAGSSAELDRVKTAMDRLRKAGITVSHDWVACINEVGSANPAGATDADRAQWAWEDLRGVKNADILWVLWPETPSAGACVELGYAIRGGQRIIISGNHKTSIFTTSGECYDTDYEALAEVLSTAEWFGA
jgi:hypothetical protein